MGSSVASPHVSIEKYLSDPAYEHCEYVDGEVQQLNVGTRFHARIQGRCFRKLDEYFDTRPGNYVGAELHCRLRIGGKVTFRLPDLAVVLGGFTEDYLDRGPDLAIEIRSPEDSIASQLRKIDDYFQNGTKLAWLILPEEQSVLVILPSGVVRTVVRGEILEGGDLLPGLGIAVADLNSPSRQNSAMGTSVVSPHLSIEEYLSDPAYEHCEYVDGAVQQLNVGTRLHARIQVKCSRKLDEYFDTRPGHYVGAELHCRLRIRGKVTFRLPDLAVVLGGFTEDYLDRGPDLAIEIRSPEDSIASQLRKIDDYFQNGTKLAWLILPEEQSVLVILPSGVVKTVVTGEILDGGDLLPGLAIAVADLFS